MQDITTIPNNGYTAKTFSVAGSRLWNNTLDADLRGCTNVELFKKIRHYCLGPFINANIVLIHCNLYVCLFHSILLYSVSLYFLLSTVICFSLHTLD